VRVRFVGPQPTLRYVELRPQYSFYALSLFGLAADPLVWAERVRWGPLSIGDVKEFVVRRQPTHLGRLRPVPFRRPLPEDFVLIAECEGQQGARWTRMLRIPAGR